MGRGKDSIKNHLAVLKIAANDYFKEPETVTMLDWCKDSSTDALDKKFVKTLYRIKTNIEKDIDLLINDFSNLKIGSRKFALTCFEKYKENLDKFKKAVEEKINLDPDKKLTKDDLDAIKKESLNLFSFEGFYKNIIEYQKSVIEKMEKIINYFENTPYKKVVQNKLDGVKLINKNILDDNNLFDRYKDLNEKICDLWADNPKSTSTRDKLSDLFLRAMTPQMANILFEINRYLIKGIDGTKVLSKKVSSLPDITEKVDPSDSENVKIFFAPVVEKFFNKRNELIESFNKLNLNLQKKMTFRKTFKELLFPYGKATLEDINQRAIGDCYFLAAIQNILNRNAEDIKKIFLNAEEIPVIITKEDNQYATSLVEFPEKNKLLEVSFFIPSVEYAKEKASLASGKKDFKYKFYSTGKTVKIKLVPEFVKEVGGSISNRCAYWVNFLERAYHEFRNKYGEFSGNERTQISGFRNKITNLVNAVEDEVKNHLNDDDQSKSRAKLILEKLKDGISQTIDGGYSAYVFTTLTGKESKFTVTVFDIPAGDPKPVFNDKDDIEKLFEKIIKKIKTNKKIMGLSFRNKFSTPLYNEKFEIIADFYQKDVLVKIIDRHQYSIFDVYKNGGKNYIKLRNPWGYNLTENMEKVDAEVIIDFDDVAKNISALDVSK
ncbi:MAG: hypothetical protein RsTaC01_0939 [Candidatus Paraimprobicoccus trichonymphae]|uniref:Calpain catalytic domain-containing protein n=1 Tax=Candidatus Paraimprobicoccus trichonymphae TaxID=3033793 RepID=A0AA48L1L8_9FIRM|nr:MAG: hypothetical protein RsTaC01_0939 [Candidatus Paraimprobicoccus trichonymphae]